ncbi:hypothetical protein JXQ70_10200 [bacterium]|nr:hypothetical protein [bacterium]
MNELTEIMILNSNKKILDKEISLENYANFSKCEIFQEGKFIRFTMKCGVSYEVPIAYLLKWFFKPHYNFVNGKISRFNNNGVSREFDLSIIKCRRILKNTAVRIYMNNDTAYDISWDTVLIACEKDYENFGGWDKESREIVKQGFIQVRRVKADK